MKTDCIICTKHSDFESYCGKPVAEKSGMVLCHFPFLPGEKSFKGRLLIEPLRHVKDISELSGDEARALGELMALGQKLVKEKFGAEHLYVFRINDKVEHLHFHLIPRYHYTPKEFWGFKILEFSGNASLSLAEIKELANDLRINIQSFG